MKRVISATRRAIGRVSSCALVPLQLLGPTASPLRDDRAAIATLTATVRREYRAIVRDMPRMHPDRCALARQGLIVLYCTAYFDGDDLRFIRIEERTARVRSVERYYYDRAGALVFVMQQQWPCAVGACRGVAQVDRLYFAQGTVMHWLRTGGEVVPVDRPEARRTARRLATRAVTASLRAWRVHNAREAQRPPGDVRVSE